jgi:primary-amine oxidase
VHYVLENALTLYERDGGLLWKHFDYETGKPDARRARELVIGYTVVVGNYDYGVSWIFRQDGSLEMEAALTGILLGKGVEATACESCAGLAEGRQPISGSERTGTLVGPNVIAPNHQHFFNFRLDFDVDGPTNSVAELNTPVILPVISLAPSISCT